MRTILLLPLAGLAACAQPAADDQAAPANDVAAVAPAPTPAPAPRDDNAVPRPAEVRVFRDWAVACDNGQRCEAVSMMPGEAEIGDYGLTVSREAGPDGRISVALRSGQGKAGPFWLVVDGRRIADGSFSSDGQAGFDPAASARIAAAIVDGQGLYVRSDSLENAQLPLSGASAALRYMDAEQGRAGTTSALVAKGPATSVPPAPALPVVLVPAPPHEDAAVAPALVARMREQADCPADDFGPASAEPTALAGGRTLVLLSCGTGAYNATFVPFVVSGDTIAYAPFDVVPSWGEDDGKPALVNAAFDLRTGLLSSFAKGRGIGDCGVSQSYAWDGRRFRLVDMRSLGECRGGMTWPTVWRAEVKRAG